MKIIKTITSAAILMFVGGVAQATTLKVDISDSVADVASGYAGFVFQITQFLVHVITASGMQAMWEDPLIQEAALW